MVTDSLYVAANTEFITTVHVPLCHDVHIHRLQGLEHYQPLRHRHRL